MTQLAKTLSFHFKDGLKELAKVELEICGVQALDNVIIAKYLPTTLVKRPNSNKSGE